MLCAASASRAVELAMKPAMTPITTKITLSAIPIANALVILSRGAWLCPP